MRCVRGLRDLGRRSESVSRSTCSGRVGIDSPWRCRRSYTGSRSACASEHRSKDLDFEVAFAEAGLRRCYIARYRIDTGAHARCSH